jgi:hypothetical protein
MPFCHLQGNPAVCNAKLSLHCNLSLLDVLSMINTAQISSDTQELEQIKQTTSVARFLKYFYGLIGCHSPCCD